MAASRRLAFEIPLCLLAMLAGGCGGKGPKAAVPEGAKRLDTRADPRGMIPFIATDPGIAYIVDTKSGKVVFSVQMEIRDQLVVHPVKDMIFFNGTLARQGGLDPKRTYQLYFLKG